MLHGNFQGAVAAHRGAADSAGGSCGIHAICGLDDRNKLRYDHVLPLLAAVAHVRIETGAAAGNCNDELAGLSFSDHAIQNLIGLPPQAPASLVLEKAVEEVQH